MASTPLDKGHPLMQAWERYRSSERYANAVRWLKRDGLRADRAPDGEMWSAMLEGWQAVHGLTNEDPVRAAPPSGGGERAPRGHRKPVGRCASCNSDETPVSEWPLTSCISCGAPWRNYVMEDRRRSPQEGPRETPIGWVVVEDQGVAVGAKFVYGSSDDETMDALMTREDAERLAEALRERAQTGLTYTVEPVGGSQRETDLLAVLEREGWDLRCVDVPCGDDSDVWWNVVEHHMQQPRERTVGEGGRTPAEALRAALSTAPRTEE